MSNDFDQQNAQAGGLLQRFELQLKPLWLAAQTGDEQAYVKALSLIAQTLRRFFARRLGRLDSEVEDAVQEALLAIHLKRSTYSADYPVSAWVFGIARHKLADVWRRWGHTGQWQETLDDLDELEAPGQANDGEARMDLTGLLNQLPAKQAAAIRLTKLEGLSLEEASAQTGASVAALKVQVHRGLKTLADWVRRKNENQ